MVANNMFVAAATSGVIAALSAQGVAAELELNYYARIWGVEGTEEELDYEEMCAIGEFQSPINLKPNFSQLEQLPSELHATFNFPMIADPYIRNTGHNLQMAWDTDTAFDMTDKSQFPQIPAGGSAIRDILEDQSLPIDRMVTMIPIQMHWHEASEHTWDGLLGAAEAHIVTYIAEGDATDWGCDVVWGADADPTDEESATHLNNCIAVFGIFYRLSDEEDVPTDDFFLTVEETGSPYEEESGEGTAFPVNPFDLNSVIPEDKSYYTYVGSLTTPPCSEGLRWHVFNEHMPISREAYSAMELHVAHTSAGEGDPEQNYRHNNRDIQYMGNRTLFFADSGAAEIPGTAQCSGSIDINDVDMGTGMQMGAGSPGPYGDETARERSEETRERRPRGYEE